jgi:hypothetical protein
MTSLALDLFRSDTPQTATFEVDVCRTAYSFATIQVQASSLAQAQLKALDCAGNHLYNEKASEYTLVDPVPEVQQAFLREQPAALDSKVMPFMTAVGGHVIIHDGLSGNPLQADWQGVCVDGFDNSSYWYIGRSGNERTFTKLAARDADAAENEGAIAAGVERAVELIASQWDKCLYDAPNCSVDIGTSIRQAARKVAIEYHAAPSVKYEDTERVALKNHRESGG